MKLFNIFVCISSITVTVILYQPLFTFDFKNFKDRMLEKKIIHNIDKFSCSVAFLTVIYALPLSRGRKSDTKPTGRELLQMSFMASLLTTILFYIHPHHR